MVTTMSRAFLMHTYIACEACSSGRTPFGYLFTATHVHKGSADVAQPLKFESPFQNVTVAYGRCDLFLLTVTVKSQGRARGDEGVLILARITPTYLRGPRICKTIFTRA
jgi:hypothetical protein